jgi:hypothetical protein
MRACAYPIHKMSTTMGDDNFNPRTMGLEEAPDRAPEQAHGGPVN